MTVIYMTGRRVFIDTGAFIAVTYQRDQYHRKAGVILQEIIRNKVIPVTTNLIVAETYSFLRYNVNYPAAIGFLEKIKNAEAIEKIEVIYATSEIEREALQILRKYSDQALSYVDAVSFAVLARNPDLKDIFAFNGHFHLLKKNLLDFL